MAEIIELNGKALTKTEWAKELGLNPSTLCVRFRRGWTKERALNSELENNRGLNYKHGETVGGKVTRLYRKWSSMKGHCGWDSSYKNISVCPELSNNYMIFRDWANKNGYKDGLEIHRIDSARDYGPYNCVFLTPKEHRQIHSIQKAA